MEPLPLLSTFHSLLMKPSPVIFQSSSCLHLTSFEMNKLKQVILTVGAFTTACFGAVVCESPGFFCLSELKYAWCNEDDLAAKPTEWTCQTGNICKCGKTASEYGPCAWAFEEVNGTCTGYAGNVLRDFSTHPRSLSSVYQRLPSAHLPFSIHFNTTIWETQLMKLTQKPFYENQKLFVPADKRNYQCSFHQHTSYDSNPSQLWIGMPSDTIRLSGKEWYPRLPDTTTALYLGFVMDHYGMFVVSSLSTFTSVDAHLRSHTDFDTHLFQ